MRQWLWFLLGMLLLVLLSVILALYVGELKFTLRDLWSLILNGAEENNISHQLILKIRLPRIVLGMAVGGSLSLAGVILQGIYRNPLVEPYTLGISGGASIGVAGVIVLGLHLTLGSFMLPLFGFLGSLLIIFLVYTLNSGKGQIDMNNMLLTGVMISFIASSGMMLMMALTSTENLHGIIFWIMGSLDESNDFLIKLVVISSLSILILTYLFVQPLNALRLGEEKAQHLGINTQSSIRILFILASLLAGICVSVAGVIGFVGLIIPHLLRLIIGSDYRLLLFGSYMAGGAFVVLSDVIARTIISPNELPIGVITGIVGGVVFIFLMSKKSKAF